VVAFNSMEYNASEEVSATTITVTSNAASDLATTVDYATSNGTALAGSDYITATGTLTFTPGVTTTTFTIPIVNDSLDEPDETVTLTLSNLVNAALGAPNPAILTITDDDMPVVRFSSSSYYVGEEDGSATITATLDMPSWQTVWAEYATSDGTALAGRDYVTATGTLTFTPGVTTTTFAIPIINDSLDEPDKTVTLTLSSPVNAGLDAPNPATLTIVNNDYYIFLPLVLRQMP